MPICRFLEGGSLKDKWRFAVWFVVALILMGLQVSEEDLVNSLDWLLLIPVWLIALVVVWLWTPWFLLHRQIELRQLLPDHSRGRGREPNGLVVCAPPRGGVRLIE